MLRFNVVLMVILSLYVVNQSISHPGNGATVKAKALCSWDQPHGQGDGEITIETWVEFKRGAHNPNNPHEDPGHQFESLQNRIMANLHGETVYYKYFYDLRAVQNSNKIKIAPAPYVRSAEQCYDCYAYASGKFRWGDGIVYSSPSDTKSHPVKLPKNKCGGSAQSRQPELPHNEAFDELRRAVTLARVADSNIIGAVNENGVVHTHTGDYNQEFDRDSGMVSGVTQEISAAPPAKKPKFATLAWASLKRK